MSKTFEDMTNTELAEVAEQYKLTDKVNELAAETAKAEGKQKPKNPNKDAYLKVLNEFKDSKTADAIADGAIAPKDKDGKTKVGNTYSSAGKSVVEMKEDYRNSKGMYIITDHNNNQSVEEEEGGRVLALGYGNKLGKKTAYIQLDGAPQYIPQGAINALRLVTLPVNMKKTTSKDRKRFGIQPLDGWTQAQIDAKIEEQRTKLAV